MSEIAVKTDFLSKTNLPFIFTSVNTSSFILGGDLDEVGALQDYNMMTEFMREYKNWRKGIIGKSYVFM